jgi:proteasome accessory factor B
VWVADGRATALRRAGRSVAARQLAGRGGEVIELDIGSADQLARDIAGYGADAVALEPESLREDVLARLRAQAEVGVEPPAGGSERRS